MATKRQIFIISSIFLQLLALTSLAHGKSVTGDKDQSSNGTFTGKSSNETGADPLLAAGSDHNVEFQGTSVSVNSESHQQPPQAPNPGYNIPNPSYAAPVPASGYELPPPPQQQQAVFPQSAPFPPAVGFGFPGFGGNLGLDLDIGGGGYYPIVEKAIIVVGGGILLLVILAIIQAGFVKGGLLHGLGHGLFEDSIGTGAGVHGGVSASASVSKNAQLSSNVANSIDKKF